MNNPTKQQLLKLSNSEKQSLTIGFLTELLKNGHLNLNDIIEIFNSSYVNLTDIKKFEMIGNEGVVTASKILRVFNYGYAKSMSIINLLIEHNAIQRQEKGYKVISKTNFNKVGQILFNK